jgi:hypothetical protein
MTRLAIPSPLAAALLALGALDEPDFAALRRALDSVEELVSRGHLVAVMADVIGNARADALVAALADALAARPEMRTTIGELVAQSLDLPPGDEPALRRTIATRVDALLATTSGPAILALKRASTVSDRPAVLDKVRIATDIRPVFADAGDSAQATHEAAATIVHTLRIDIFENWQPASIYVALPEDGLALLKAIVERAEHKQRILTNMLDNGELALLPADPPA